MSTILEATSELVGQFLRAADRFVGQERSSNHSFPMSWGTREREMRKCEEASDPELLTRLREAERQLGITYVSGPYTPLEKRLAVCDHLRDPADPRFQTDIALDYLSGYRTAESVSRWPKNPTKWQHVDLTAYAKKRAVEFVNLRFHPGVSQPQ